jgi:hypothetical protein
MIPRVGSAPPLKLGDAGAAGKRRAAMGRPPQPGSGTAEITTTALA